MWMIYRLKEFSSNHEHMFQRLASTECPVSREKTHYAKTLEGQISFYYCMCGLWEFFPSWKGLRSLNKLYPLAVWIDQDNSHFFRLVRDFYCKHFGPISLVYHCMMASGDVSCWDLVGENVFIPNLNQNSRYSTSLGYESSYPSSRSSSTSSTEGFDFASDNEDIVRQV